MIHIYFYDYGLANVLEDGYDATGWLLVGLLQLLVMLAVIHPLERWRPVEPLRDRFNELWAAVSARPPQGPAGHRRLWCTHTFGST